MKQETKDPPLGKYQKMASFIWFEFVYFITYFVAFHLVYAIVTLNIHIIAFYAVVSILQTRFKRSQRFIDWVNNTFQFKNVIKSSKAIFEEEINPKQKCLFGFHPHGVLATSLRIFMNDPRTPLFNFRTLASRFMMSVPFAGIIFRLTGFEGVDGPNMKHLLHEGINIGIVPGGYEEATLTVRDEMRIFIKNRKGFIKYAMQYNYSIHPVLSLNEHKMFWTFRSFEKLRLWLNRFKVPEVLYWNRSSGIFPPTNHEWIAIVGKGIRGKHYNKGQIPTQQEIDQVHSRYIEEIKRIHQKYQHLSPSSLKIY